MACPGSSSPVRGLLVFCPESLHVPPGMGEGRRGLLAPALLPFLAHVGEACSIPLLARWPSAPPVDLPPVSRSSLSLPSHPPRASGLGSGAALPWTAVCKATPASGLYRHRNEGTGDDISAQDLGKPQQTAMKDSPVPGPGWPCSNVTSVASERPRWFFNSVWTVASSAPRRWACADVLLPA